MTRNLVQADRSDDRCLVPVQVYAVTQRDLSYLKPRGNTLDQDMLVLADICIIAGYHSTVLPPSLVEIIKAAQKVCCATMVIHVTLRLL